MVRIKRFTVLLSILSLLLFQTGCSACASSSCCSKVTSCSTQKSCCSKASSCSSKKACNKDAGEKTCTKSENNKEGN